jgi:hypothetical protein
MAASLAFRFNAPKHEYIDLASGAALPHITGMMIRAGVIDDMWFTEESCVRGQVVHSLTADYDLGALDLASCVSPYRGYLLAHAEAIGLLQPEFLAIEEPSVHPVHRFGGRPDREVRVAKRIGVLEGKSGGPSKAHPIQTALQCILVAPKYNLPPELIQRFCLYLKPDGKWRLQEHGRRADFDEAYRIIREHAR